MLIYVLNLKKEIIDGFKHQEILWIILIVRDFRSIKIIFFFLLSNEKNIESIHLNNRKCAKQKFINDNFN